MYLKPDSFRVEQRTLLRKHKNGEVERVSVTDYIAESKHNLAAVRVEGGSLCYWFNYHIGVPRNAHHIAIEKHYGLSP